MGCIAINSIRKSQAMRLIRGKVDHAQLAQTAFALENHEMVLESFRAVDHYGVAVGNPFLPLFSGWIVHRRRHHTEIARLLVGGNEKARIMVGDGIFHALLSW